MAEGKRQATQESVQQALLDALERMASSTSNAGTLLKLSEAYAWVVAPAQPHGGSE